MPLTASLSTLNPPPNALDESTDTFNQSMHSPDGAANVFERASVTVLNDGRLHERVRRR